MALGLTSYGVSFLAGVLSILSPCVLPLVPILLGSAASSHRFGPYALVGGLMLSFTAIGVVLGSMGTAVGIDQAALRLAGGLLLLLLGVILVSQKLQERFSAAISRLGIGQDRLARFSLGGFHGQFLLGMLLGVVWSPCVGPTLGVAITLASQGRELTQVAVVMLLFSLGAALPLLAISMMSNKLLLRWREKMLNAGQVARKIFGLALLLVGAMILSGTDKLIEEGIVNAMPDWLIMLTTRF